MSMLYNFCCHALQLVNIQDFRNASVEDICSVHELSYVRGLEKLAQRGKDDIVESVAPTYITGTSFDNALAVQPSRPPGCVFTADAAILCRETGEHARSEQGSCNYGARLLSAKPDHSCEHVCPSLQPLLCMAPAHHILAQEAHRRSQWNLERRCNCRLQAQLWNW